MVGWLVLAFVIVPATASNYVLTDLLTPFLIMSIAALGLNVLTGYCGQLSLGTGAFMALGGFMTYKLVTAFPTAGALLSAVFGSEIALPDLAIGSFRPFDLWFLVLLAAAGTLTALVGLVFGLPSLKIKGLYLAVTTLAAQFFLIWLFIKVPWFTNYSPAGIAPAPPQTLLGLDVTGAASPVLNRYLFVLILTLVIALAVKNLTRCHTGRSWMAIRDMDIAAEIIGVHPTVAKLSAFAFSSFLIGIAGALWAFVKINSVQTDAYGILLSFQVLFMVIIGGLGSILGSFLGAAFVTFSPILLNIGLTSLNPYPRDGGRPANRGGDDQAHRVHGVRLLDHLLPDRRAQWAGPPLANCQTEAENLAVSLLTMFASAAAPLPAPTLVLRCEATPKR